MFRVFSFEETEETGGKHIKSSHFLLPFQKKKKQHLAFFLNNNIPSCINVIHTCMYLCSCCDYNIHIIINLCCKKNSNAKQKNKNKNKT